MITDHEPLSPAALARGHVESALASLHRMFALDEATALLHIARAIETRQADLDRETWNARVETLETARGIIAAPAGQPDETLRKAALVVIAQDLDPTRIAEAEGILALVDGRHPPRSPLSGASREKPLPGDVPSASGGHRQETPGNAVPDAAAPDGGPQREAPRPFRHSRDPQSCGPVLRVGGLSPSGPQDTITTTPLAGNGGSE